MSTTDAMKKHDWLEDYLWKAVQVDTDKYTAEVELEQTHRYFIRLEADSELHIITGCSVSHAVNSALHLGVSEFYVKKGAKITFTMIHNWNRGMEVRPRSAEVIEDDGTFISNCISMTPVKSLQMYPTAYCVGRNARATFQTIIYDDKI